jgi:hypothetical protein
MAWSLTAKAAAQENGGDFRHDTCGQPLVKETESGYC